MDIQTWPSMRELNLAALSAPDYMMPATVPYAVWVSECLSIEACIEISAHMQDFETYNHPGCDASRTRELSMDAYNSALNTVDILSRQINDKWFGYNLSRESTVWHQTYTHEGSSYQNHMDGSPGVTRKLTAIVMLSDPDIYDGGSLICEVPGDGGMVAVNPSVSQGTVIWIQPWLIHRVTPVTRGHRESINMGFFGPPFK
jgi:predicted 2-oxoglutarate/Fe(II)-dependent dioxygenase YbiX